MGNPPTRTMGSDCGSWPQRFQDCQVVLRTKKTWKLQQGKLSNSSTVPHIHHFPPSSIPGTCPVLVGIDWDVPFCNWAWGHSWAKKCDSSFVPGLTWEKHPTWIGYLCIPSWKTNISHLWKTKIIFKGVLGRYFIIYLFFIYHCLSLPSQMSTQPTLQNPLNPCLLAKLLQTWQQTTGFLMEEMLRSPVELGSFISLSCIMYKVRTHTSH